MSVTRRKQVRFLSSARTSIRRFILRGLLPSAFIDERLDHDAAADELDKLWPPQVHPEPGWDLVPLTPVFIEAAHTGYVASIRRALDKDDITNIALSGNYGVGKSSILRRVSDLEAGRVVELSLSTLAPVERKDVDSSVPVQATTPTNQIQQEIVKQLLYRENPETTPGSRFRRIEKFQPARAITLATIAGIATTILFAITGWATSLANTLSPLWDPELWIYPMVLCVSALGFFTLGGMLHGRVRVSQLSAGSAAVTLNEKSVSYFDQYLDEIVYFFQTSRRDIVIFEDIDRFDDPHIFETLRSLNTLLNAAPQLRSPVRFIYAIRDSIFDRDALEADRRGGNNDEATATTHSEVLRANRTKFFDLIIPVVPFITHESARDLAAQILAGIEHDVSDELVDIATRFIPDMRLLKNVRNEFIVFRGRVLAGGGEGLNLSQTELFAMMLYKSTHLKDFESIRFGTSRLDVLYHLSRQLVSHNISKIEHERSALRSTLRNASLSSERAKRLGTAVIEHIAATASTVGYAPQNGTLSFRGTALTEDALGTVDFWRQLSEAPDDAAVTWRNNYGHQINLTRKLLEGALGEDLDQAKWADLDVENTNDQAEKKWMQLQRLRGADMKMLAAHSEFTLPHAGEDLSFLKLAEQVLGRGLAYELVRAGFINSNFTLYTSIFHGDRVGPVATNFLIHTVDRNQSDPHFLLSPDDVRDILRERGRDVLAEAPYWNTSILDYVLTVPAPDDDDDDPAEVMLDALATGGPIARSFIESYVVGSPHRTLFAGRYPQQDPRALTFFANAEDLEEEDVVEVLSHALRGLSEKLDYETNDSLAALLDQHQEALLTSGAAASRSLALSIAKVFASASVRITDLKNHADVLQRAFISQNAFKLTYSNLSVALGDNQSLALDSIRETAPEIYSYVLANLDQYLVLLPEGSHSNDQGDSFARTIHDVHEGHPALLQEVIDRANPENSISNISRVPVDAWKLLARRRRMLAGFTNVSQYLEKIGRIDADLAALLESERRIYVHDSRTEPERAQLALTIIGSRDELTSGRLRAELAASLGLKKYLDADQITPEDGDLIPSLIGLDVIADDADAFAVAQALSWSTREATLAESDNARNLVSPEFLGDDLAPFFVSSSISEDIKNVVVESAGQYVSRAKREGLTELAKYAHPSSHPLPMVVVSELARGKVPGTLVLPHLVTALTTVADDVLFEILIALGKPYSQLASVGREVPLVENTACTVLLLNDLARRGIVSTFDASADPIRVFKRRK